MGIYLVYQLTVPSGSPQSTPAGRGTRSHSAASGSPSASSWHLAASHPAGEGVSTHTVGAGGVAVGEAERLTLLESILVAISNRMMA